MPSSFTEALCLKYGQEITDVENISSSCEIFVVGSAPTRSTPDGKFINVPKSLTLHNYNISSAGSTETIRHLCHDISELDLAQNQLSDITEIDKIISQLSNLWFLNLSHNDLEESEPTEMSPNLSMRSLVLNHTHIGWNSLTSFLDAMPNLKELHLSLNGYQRCNMDMNKRYENIQKIHINSNPLRDWEDVVQLGRNFPALESLVMADCAIENIPEPSLWSRELSSLRSLNINNGPLKEWDDIDRLHGIPYLEDIRVLGIPLLDELKDEERRQHLVARLPKVKKLNGSDITAKEREDAERSFIRYFQKKEERPERFLELERKHGQLEPLVEIDFTVKKTAEVEIIFPNHSQEVLTIDLFQTVYDLKVLLAAKCNLIPSKIRLFYDDPILMYGMEEMRFNTKQLYTLRIKDGYRIEVEKKL